MNIFHYSLLSFPKLLLSFVLHICLIESCPFATMWFSYPVGASFEAVPQHAVLLGWNEELYKTGDPPTLLFTVYLN